MSDDTNYGTEIKRLTQKIKVDPHNAAAYSQRGLLYKTKSEVHDKRVNEYYDKNDYERAFKEFSRFHTAYKQGIEDLSTAISLEPSNAAFYKNRGEIYNMFNFGESQEAINDYSKAISLDPNDADAYVKRGETYANMKDYVAARMNYDQAIRIEPNNSKTWYKRGCIQEDDLKIADLSRAIELDPAYIDAYNERADEYFYKGNYFQDGEFFEESDDAQANSYYDLAIEDYSQIIRIDPANAVAYGHRGGLNNRKGKYDDAIADLTEALNIDPVKNNYAWGLRADAYYRKCEYDKAIADYTEMIKCYPEWYFNYKYRGDVYAAKGDYEKAIVDYTMALSIKPDSVAVKKCLEKVRRQYENDTAD
ncbi:hypothetical protein AGMMS49587_14200 [Spirochaetia bacterium]|nr:hypothetical protein AGMMS49587_14200 [Spirochaetia bacterium]